MYWVLTFPAVFLLKTKTKFHMVLITTLGVLYFSFLTESYKLFLSWNNVNTSSQNFFLEGEVIICKHSCNKSLIVNNAAQVSINVATPSINDNILVNVILTCVLFVSSQMAVRIDNLHGFWSFYLAGMRILLLFLVLLSTTSFLRTELYIVCCEFKKYFSKISSLSSSSSSWLVIVLLCSEAPNQFPLHIWVESRTDICSYIVCFGQVDLVK